MLTLENVKNCDILSTLQRHRYCINLRSDPQSERQWNPHSLQTLQKYHKQYLLKEQDCQLWIAGFGVSSFNWGQ